MFCKHRVLGLALTAIFAFSVLAQSASASPLTVASGEVHITGAQEGSGMVFTAGESGEVKCTTSTSDSTATAVSGQINEITGSPTFSGCTAFGSPADVKVNGCTGTSTTGTSIAAGVVTWGPEQGHQLCPTGKSIEITPTFVGASVCTLFIGPQTATGGHVVGRNVAGSSPMDITMESAASGIHYTGSGGICGNGETHTNATLSGNATARCYSNVAHTIQIDCTFS